MQALDATYILTGKAAREVKARDFYRGAFVTALKDDEILTGIRIPMPARGHGYAYLKQSARSAIMRPPPPQWC